MVWSWLSAIFFQKHIFKPSHAGLLSFIISQISNAFLREEEEVANACSSTSMPFGSPVRNKNNANGGVAPPKSPTRSSFYTKSSVTAASPPKSPIKSPGSLLSPTRESKKKQLNFGEGVSTSSSSSDEWQLLVAFPLVRRRRSILMRPETPRHLRRPRRVLFVFVISTSLSLGASTVVVFQVTTGDDR